MIKHIVTWRLKETDSTEKAKQAKIIKEQLTGLKSRIVVIKSLEVGINSEKADENNWDVVLITEFESLEMLEVYIKHADHQYVVSKIKHYFASRACVDFEA